MASQMFNSADTLPVISPIVTFTGPIIGSGHTLLHPDTISDLEDIQAKCCGFIQLSTYLTPGNPTKTPFMGFHPFQIFVIFPIHVNPWSSLCRKMIERQETQFQPNTLFSCSGKVAGFLDHNIMIHPPQLTQDYVFIVVPDTWQFYDKTTLDSIFASSSASTPAKQPSKKMSGRSKFYSPSTPVTQQSTSPTTTTTSHTQSTNLTPSCWY